MKIEPVQVVQDHLGQMLTTLHQGPVIITQDGRPCAALVSLPAGTDLEAFLVAHHPRLLSLIERAMSQPGGVPLEAVEAEVSRRERKSTRGKC